MTEKFSEDKIEEYLKKAIDDTTPDILDSLMEELDHEPPVRETVFNPVPRKRKHIRFRAIASAAAALLILAGSFTMLRHNQNRAYARVYLDVNPSVELTVNKGQAVIDVEALNEDGKNILKDSDLKGNDILKACIDLADTMTKQGYISSGSPSILVSVQSGNQTGGREIEKMVCDSLNSYLREHKFSGAVMGQYVDDDEELDSFAAENVISPGKAWVIKSLMNTGSSHMDENSLLKLSTQELILLGQERKIGMDDSYGQADTGKYLSMDRALEIALNQESLDKTQIEDQEVEFDCDDGIITYEVEFRAGEIEYEYVINAETGEIIGCETSEEDGQEDDQDDSYKDDDHEDDHDEDQDDDHDDNQNDN